MKSKEDKRLTPYDAAVLKDHTECAEWLRAHGGKPTMHAADKTGKQTPVASEKRQDKAKDRAPEDDNDKLKETSELAPEDSVKEDDKVEKTAEVSTENGEKEEDQMEKAAAVDPKNSEKEDGTEQNTAEVNLDNSQKEEGKVQEGEQPESDGKEEDKTPNKPDGTTEDTPAEEKDKNGGEQVDKAYVESASNAMKDDKDQGDSDKEQVDDDNKETDCVGDNVNEDDNKAVKSQGNSEAEVDPVASSSRENPDNKISESDDVKVDTCVGEKRDADEEQTDNETSKSEAAKPESELTTDSGKTNPDSVQAEKDEYNALVKKQAEEKTTEEAMRKDAETQDSPVHKEHAEEKDSVEDKPTKKAVSSDNKASSDSSDDASSPKPQQNGLDENHPTGSKEEDKSRVEDNDNQDKPHMSVHDNKEEKDNDDAPKKPDETVPSETPEGPMSNDDDNNKDETSDGDDFWSPVHKKSEGGTEKCKDKDVDGTPQEEKDTESKVHKSVSEDTKKTKAEPRDSGMENSTDGEHTSEDDIQQDKPHAKENKPEAWAKISEKSPSKNPEPNSGRNPGKPQRPKTVCVTERKHVAPRPQPIKHASQYPEKRRKSQQDVPQKEHNHNQANGTNHRHPLADNNVHPTSQLTRPKTTIGLRRCRNEIQESVRIFEVKKLDIQMIQKTRKLRMFNTYRQTMSERAMIRMLVRDYNQLSRHKQDEQDFSTVADWEMFLLDDLAQANRTEKDNRMRVSDESRGRHTNAPAASPPIFPPPSHSNSSISDSQGSPRQQSPQRRRSPTREEKRLKLKEEQCAKQLRNIYGQQNMPLEQRNYRYPKSAGRSRGKSSAASSLASSTTESLPKIHTHPTRQPKQKSPSYSMRPVTSHAGQRSQAGSQGSGRNASSP